jgi:hypothetical protein
MESSDELLHYADISWPDWLLNVSNDGAESLEAISTILKRLRAGTPDAYAYKHVLQKQLHRVQDVLVRTGKIKEGQLHGTINVPADYTAALVQHNGSPVRILAQLCAVKRMVCVQLLESSRLCAKTGSLLVCLICIRSLLEQIAHFHVVVNELKTYEVPLDFQKANEMIWQINETLVRGTYASSVDWEELAFGNTQDLIDKNKVKYRPKENRVNRSVDSVMKGTRPIYEILSDFAHPNVGPLLTLTKECEIKKDNKDVYWVEKILSLGNPVAASKVMAPILSRIFLVVKDCLVHFEELIDEADGQKQKTLQICQIVVRNILAQKQDFVTPYSFCPCASGAKVKFCCAKKER